MSVTIGDICETRLQLRARFHHGTGIDADACIFERRLDDVRSGRRLRRTRVSARRRQSVRLQQSLHQNFVGAQRNGNRIARRMGDAEHLQRQREIHFESRVTEHAFAVINDDVEAAKRL